MTFKKIIRIMHRWLGLLAGLVVFIICLTGAIYSFQPELSKLAQSYQSVSPQNQPYLPVTSIKAAAQKELPSLRITRITYRSKADAVSVMFTGKKPKPYHYNVYINPYTGEVLKVKNMDHDFFGFILHGHRNLWMPEHIGRPITVYATLIFLVMILSGIILWWPKRKAARRQRFRLYLTGSWKRRNYDLHSVLGFYASWVLLFAVLTGLAWGFELLPSPKPVKVRPASYRYSLDDMAHYIHTNYPDAERFTFNLPANDSAIVLSRVYAIDGIFYNSENLHFNPYTGKPARVDRYNDLTTGQKLTRLNYDIHVGSAAGLPGRILLFFAALIGASLPVTGVLMWWGKRRRRKAYLFQSCTNISKS